MATELQLQQGFQTLLRTLSIFSNSDVYINNDNFLDDSIGDAPYAVIWSSQSASLTPASARLVGTMVIPISLVEAFDVSGWGATYANITTNREAIRSGVFTGTGMSAGGVEGAMVTAIDYLPFIPILQRGVSEDAVNSGQVLPVFIEVPINVTVRLL